MSSTNIETRNRILKAAWSLLESGQGSSVRMSDIAKAAGLSRQAVYLHFPNRADLLVATTRYLDEIYDVDAGLEVSRNAATGLERLEAFIDWWGNYIPKIYGMAKALWAMQDADEAARAAWAGRMQAVREGCAAAIEALQADGVLSAQHKTEDATDILWTLLSVRNWEQFTLDCDWSQARYIAQVKLMAQQVLVE